MSDQSILNNIKQLLIETLSLNMQLDDIQDDMLLLGNIPEFDSMAIVSVITAIEEQYQFTADDDDLSAEVFESVASLADFVQQRVN